MTAHTSLRFNEELRTLVIDRLGGFRRRAHVVDDRHHAAVTLTLVELGHGADVEGLSNPGDWSDEAALVLTRRAASLRRHAGQWALPGGRIDAGEGPQQAALRELAEEVALECAPEDVLGALDDFTTRSGFVITPVVVWGGRGDRMRPNPAEVASIHRIPLAEFGRPDAPLLDTLEGSEQPVLRMPIGTTSIAAPTAALLYQFRELVLAGRVTRVDHYEQPRFAWR